MNLRRALVLALTATTLVAVAPSTALADDDPRKVRAEAAFQEGVKLQSQGRSAEALAKLKEAYATYPSPNTLGGIARIEQALGRSLDAIRHYREALRNPLTHPENAEYAKRAIAELEKHLGRIDVRGPTGLAVRIDDRDLVLPLVEPLDVEPSAVMLRGKLAGAEYEGRGTAIVGQTTTIEMSLSADVERAQRRESISARRAISAAASVSAPRISTANPRWVGTTVARAPFGTRGHDSISGTS